MHASGPAASSDFDTPPHLFNAGTPSAVQIQLQEGAEVERRRAPLRRDHSGIAATHRRSRTWSIAVLPSTAIRILRRR